MADSTPFIITTVSAAKVLRTMRLIHLDCQLIRLDFFVYVYKEYDLSSLTTFIT